MKEKNEINKTYSYFMFLASLLLFFQVISSEIRLVILLCALTFLVVLHFNSYTIIRRLGNHVSIPQIRNPITKRRFISILVLCLGIMYNGTLFAFTNNSSITILIIYIPILIWLELPVGLTILIGMLCIVIAPFALVGKYYKLAETLIDASFFYFVVAIIQTFTPHKKNTYVHNK